MQTYVERDVRQLQSIRDTRAFEHFLAMACAMHAREFNSAAFSRQTGITLPTAKTWAGVLEASYLAYILPPYFNNMGKRVTKAPKLYMTDPSIACYLTRQPGADAAMAGAMGPALFEGLVVIEAVKAFTNIGRKPDLWYWRSHDGTEVSLIMQSENRIIPIEIALTNTPGTSHLEGIRRIRKLAGETSCEPGILVCRVAQEQPMAHGITAIPWWEFPAWISGRIS
jgi:predicted AAA+ superfamily ATPase